MCSSVAVLWFFGGERLGRSILPDDLSIIMWLFVCCWLLLLLLLLLLQDLLPVQEIVTLRRTLHIDDACSVGRCGLHLVHKPRRQQGWLLGIVIISLLSYQTGSPIVRLMIRLARGVAYRSPCLNSWLRVVTVIRKTWCSPLASVLMRSCIILSFECWASGLLPFINGCGIILLRFSMWLWLWLLACPHHYLVVLGILWLLLILRGLYDQSWLLLQRECSWIGVACGCLAR